VCSSDLILFFMALFTDHSVTFWNENLFLANPIILLIFILSMISLFSKSDKLREYIKNGWLIMAGLSILLFVFKILPMFDQDNWMILGLLLPINIGMAVAHWIKRMGKT